MHLECGSCRYRFEKNIIPRVCPYCNKDDVVGVVQKAQDLIDEALGDQSDIETEREERKKALSSSK